MSVRKSSLLKSYREKFGEFLVSELSPETTSKTLLEFRCPRCGDTYKSSAQKVVSRKRQYPHLNFECPKCSRLIRDNLAQKSIKDKYGTHYTHTSGYRAKIRNTYVERYGAEHPMKVDSVKRKVAETCLKRYGRVRATHSKATREAFKKTSQTKFGTDHPSQNESVKTKQIETTQKRYGVRNPAQLKTNVNKALKTKGLRLKEEALPGIIEDLKNNPNQIITSKYFQEKHGVYYVTVFRWLREENLTHLIPKGQQYSDPERALSDWIKTEYHGQIQMNVRGVLPNKKQELDIYLPEHKVAIEFHGLYWHSSAKKHKRSHLEKRQSAESVGVDLLQIYENEWRDKPEIVKSIIRTKLGLVTQKIPAKRTEFRKVADEQARSFYTQTHLMGPTNGSTHFGLFLGDDLVSLASFRRTGRGLELVRFSSKLNTVVVGGLSKLLAGIGGYYPLLDYIISYVDLRYSNGKSLTLLGFNLKSVSLGWKWTDYTYTFNRRYCVAGEGLSETAKAKAMGLDKIYDAGQAKFVKLRSNKD